MVLAEVRTTVLLDTIPSLTLCIICNKCKAVASGTVLDRVAMDDEWHATARQEVAAVSFIIKA